MAGEALYRVLAMRRRMKKLEGDFDLGARNGPGSAWAVAEA